MTRSRHPQARNLTSSPSRAPDSDLLDPSERAALVRAVLRADASASTPALTQAFDWARSVRLHALILERVLDGTVDVVLSQDGDDLIFREHAAAKVIPLNARR